MWKFLFIVLAVWVVVAYVKRSLRDQAAHGKSVPDQTKTEDMVQCTSCSVHLPRSEAFLVEGHFYCSQAHIKSK